MTGRPCTICSSTNKAKVAAEMIASGASDQQIANKLGVGRMAVQRHRHSHVMAPAKALAEVAGKGRDAAEQRAQIAAAVEAGDPSAFVMLANVVADLRRVYDRLERAADAAEQDNQRLAVASLSAQQLRAAEVRAKIGGIGGYAAPKAGGSGDGAPFAINFHFSGTGQTETVTLDAPAIDGIVEADDAAGDLGALPAGLDRLMAGRRGRK